MLRGSEPIATIGFRADNASPPSLASTLFVVAAASGPHEQRHVLASWRASVRPGAGVEHINVTNYTTPPVGKNTARGNDDPAECNPALLC